MDDLIQQLRQYQDNFNLPGNRTHLGQLSNILQGTNIRHPDTLNVPQFNDLMALYRDHNGMTLGGFDPLSIRLMSIEEALTEHTVLRNRDYISNEMYMFWSDDNSNYLGMYLAEPLWGRVFYLDHEDTDFRHVFALCVQFMKPCSSLRRIMSSAKTRMIIVSASIWKQTTPKKD